MKVIVDTSVWSLALRREAPDVDAEREVRELVRQGRVQMLGLIRQELLSGVRSQEWFAALSAELAHFVDLPVTTQDHEEAARIFKRCRAGGVEGNVVDMLICALASRHDMPICTTDRDFKSYARYIELKMHPISG